MACCEDRFILRDANFFQYDVGDLASPWCGKVFANRIDCFVGALDGNVHFFQRKGGKFTPTYEHASSNILPYPDDNKKKSAAARSRLPQGSASTAATVAAALGGTAATLAGVSPAAAALGAAGSALLGAGFGGGFGSGGPAFFAEALNVYTPKSSFRSAAAPFCGLLHTSDKHFSCLVGTATGDVELYTQKSVAGADDNLTKAEVDGSAGFVIHSSTYFARKETSVLPASVDGRRDDFAAPSCGLDLDGNGHLDCIVGSRNGTARVYMYHPKQKTGGGAYKNWAKPRAAGYYEVVTQDGQSMDVFGLGIGEALSDPTPTPTVHATLWLTASPPPTGHPTHGPTSRPTLAPTPGPTLNRPSSAPHSPLSSKAFIAPHCVDLDGDGDADCVTGFEDGRVSLWTHEGTHCGSIRDKLGLPNDCHSLPQGGFALSYRRKAGWPTHKKKNVKVAVKKHARGLRFKLRSFDAPYVFFCFFFVVVCLFVCLFVCLPIVSLSVRAPWVLLFSTFFHSSSSRP